MSKKLTSSLGDFFAKVESIITEAILESQLQHKLNFGKSSQTADEVVLVFDVIDVKTKQVLRSTAIYFDRESETFSGLSYWCDGQI